MEEDTGGRRREMVREVKRKSQGFFYKKIARGGICVVLFPRYLHIQLEKDNPNNDPNYTDALDYIAQLPFEAVS